MRRVGVAFITILPLLFAACSSDSKLVEAPKCIEGGTPCGSACVDLQSDPLHCGGCGIECSEDEACSEGVCAFTCPGWQTNCEGSCVNLMTAPSNCGACDSVCSDRETCEHGVCVPICLDLADCGGQCTDLRSDPLHCGGCGDACPLVANASPTCEGSACSFLCDEAWANCDELADNGCEAHLPSDAAHCGACGAPCREDQVCAEGACGCPEGLDGCGDACVDLQTSKENCGGCGIFCAGQSVCMEGECKVCFPGSFSCDDNTVLACREDGSGWVEKEICDEELGLVCDPEAGSCAGACLLDGLTPGDRGCEFFPTVTQNMSNVEILQYAITVANPGERPADLVIRGGALTAPTRVTVDPRAVEVVPLPWVMELLGCTEFRCSDEAVLSRRGAYHLKSTEPVVVHQFNHMQRPASWYGHLVAESSLLLPRNALSDRFFVASTSASGLREPSTITITATEDDTEVSVRTTQDVNGGVGVPPFPFGVTTQVMLAGGDALQLPKIHHQELTGSYVTATRPIQVIGGHACGTVRYTYSCDHIEESMVPIDALDSSYFVAPLHGNVHGIEVKIIATEPNTTISYDPPQPDAPTHLAAAGHFGWFHPDEPFAIQADKPILVAQYMPSWNGTASGDPAMTLALPASLYRRDALFYAPYLYRSHVQLIGPLGTDITVDGIAVGELLPIGASGMGYADVEVLGIGTHSVSASVPISISVYGYTDANSYWHPGG